MCGSSLGTRRVGGVRNPRNPKTQTAWASVRKHGCCVDESGLSKCVCVCMCGGRGCLLGAAVVVGVRGAGEWVGDSRPLSASLPGTRPQGHFKSAHPETETPIRPLSNPAKSSQVCLRACASVHVCICTRVSKNVCHWTSKQSS